MLVCDFDKTNGGWQAPKITPVVNLELDAYNATLNYSIECFEGAKAYQMHDDPDKLILYRINKNFQRMLKSHEQLGFPSFDIDEMIECTKKLLDKERSWLPQRPLHSIYLRPTSICLDSKLGLSSINKMRTFVVLSPVGPYFPEGFKPIRLYSDNSVVRAWPLGFGDKKVGGNYAPTLKVQRKGLQKYDCDASLWLLHDYVTEVGCMNIFAFWKNKDGEDELITPPLDGTVLPGITRDSILQLAKEMGGFKVSERQFKIHELIETI